MGGASLRRLSAHLVGLAPQRLDLAFGGEQIRLVGRTELHLPPRLILDQAGQRVDGWTVFARASPVQMHSRHLSLQAGHHDVVGKLLAVRAKGQADESRAGTIDGGSHLTPCRQNEEHERLSCLGLCLQRLRPQEWGCYHEAGATQQSRAGDPVPLHGSLLLQL